MFGLGMGGQTRRSSSASGARRTRPPPIHLPSAAADHGPQQDDQNVKTEPSLGAARGFWIRARGQRAIKCVIVEPDTNKATRLREDYRNATHEVLAPASFTIECADSLTKKQHQRLLPDARALWDEIMMDAPVLAPILPSMDRTLHISITTRHNFYDCLYVALAEGEGCELLTADTKLATNLQPTFPFITSLAAPP